MHLMQEFRLGCWNCANLQGSLDWFDVDISASPAFSFKEIWVLWQLFSFMNLMQEFRIEA